jgi:ergothioneine biosynthesis protein EgtB
MEQAGEDSLQQFIGQFRLTLQHEQRYQEQLLSAIHCHFAANPLQPVYHPDLPALPAAETPAQHWFDYFGGVDEIGFEGAGFAFDNERPRHQIYIHEFRLASRLVSNGEYLEFMADGGYERPDLWLHEGWECCRNLGWQAPLYWQLKDKQWYQMTLGGLTPVVAAAPVCHVSYYEAEAYARWAGKRLPHEAEWEVSAEALPVQGNLRDSGFLQPLPAAPTRAPQQLFGDAWEWTQSHHDPYPNYQPYWEQLESYENFPGQSMVLRGGSCLSAPDHIRASYRLACPPAARLPVTGFRLAESWL